MLAVFAHMSCIGCALRYDKSTRATIVLVFAHYDTKATQQEYQYEDEQGGGQGRCVHSRTVVEIVIAAG